MNIKIRHLVFTALLLLIPRSFLQAQTIKYFLEWQKDQRARRYEVVIEKEEDKEYRQTLREFTEMSSIEVSLEPGKYRYMVIPYNFLDRPGKIPDWKKFEALTVLTPELYDFSPSVFYADTDTVYELTVAGKNLNSETKIYLRHVGGAIVVPDDKKIIAPVEQEFNKDGSVRLFFDNSQLIPGDYEIVARNPGLKEISKKDFTIAPFRLDEKSQELTKKWYNRAYVGVGAYWPNMGMYWEQFSNQFSFPGLMLHCGVIFLKWGFFNLNGEFSFLCLPLETDYNSQTIHFGPGISLPMKIWLPNQLIAFCIRPGYGLLFQWDNYENRSFYWNIDFSLWINLGKHIFLEIGVVGVDFLFINDFHPYICPPFFMLGCRF